MNDAKVLKKLITEMKKAQIVYGENKNEDIAYEIPDTLNIHQKCFCLQLEITL